MHNDYEDLAGQYSHNPVSIFTDDDLAEQFKAIDLHILDGLYGTTMGEQRTQRTTPQPTLCCMTCTTGVKV